MCFEFVLSEKLKDVLILKKYTYTVYNVFKFTYLFFKQAFLEMAEEIAAVAMVAYFGGCVAQLRGRAVYVQFSNHKELKTDQTHSNAVSFFTLYIFIFILL